MSRRRLLIAYDIAEPRRLRQVIKLMEGFGERLQYSVFLCDLNPIERLNWEQQIRDVIRLSEDSVVCIDLGPLTAPAPIAVLGTPRRLPIISSTVV
jgi:CRISPR-associated protein Cas2